MLDHGKFKPSETESAHGQRFAAAKITRGQLGEGTHQMWITDFIEHCRAKRLLINDFAHGVGEVEMSAVDAKVSLPAINNAVKVSCFAYDPRKVFADMANARTFTRLASMYQAGKIQSVGHTPVPDPGPEPREDRIFVKALLPTPLTKLSLSRSGNLIRSVSPRLVRSH